MGQLKTSLSHLEYENQQLKDRTAKLEQENRSMENRLVQEQLDNGDLTARLDDARNLLRDRGIEADVRLGSRRRGSGDRLDEDDDSRTRTTPASRSTKPRRKAPFAQISSGPGDSSAPNDDARGSAASPRRGSDGRTSRSRRRSDDDLDRQSSRGDSAHWLPIANASDDSTIEIR